MHLIWKLILIGLTCHFLFVERANGSPLPSETAPEVLPNNVDSAAQPPTDLDTANTFGLWRFGLGYPYFGRYGGYYGGGFGGGYGGWGGWGGGPFYRGYGYF